MLNPKTGCGDVELQWVQRDAPPCLNQFRLDPAAAGWGRGLCNTRTKYMEEKRGGNQSSKII